MVYSGPKFVMFKQYQKFRVGHNQKIKSTASFFLRLEAVFLILRLSVFCHLTFVKVLGFHDKVTKVSCWAFEEQMTYQKYRLPPIIVR